MIIITKETIPARSALCAVVLVLSLASPAVATDDQLTAQDVTQLNHLLQPKFMVAGGCPHRCREVPPASK
jgi:hypothetical protein